MRRMLLLALFLSVPAAAAQELGDPTGVLYEFNLDVPVEPVFVPFGGNAFVEITFYDRSKDSTSGAAGEDVPIPNLQGFFHSTSFVTNVRSPDGSTEGWIVLDPPPVSTRGGDQRSVQLQILASNTIEQHSMVVDLSATTSTRDGVFYQNVSIEFFTDGLSGFSARPGAPVNEIKPGAVRQASIFITNPGLFPETYHMEMVRNPCGLSVVPPASVTLPPRTANNEVFFSVRGASDRPWYFTEDCSIAVGVSPSSNPNQQSTVPLGVVVNGGYLNPLWLFWIAAVAAAFLILLMLARRRKQVIEEEILGKPQKPWTIPVERVYLEHLEVRDPRAAYVVRHFLMEEEYASALMWYKHYKQATKGERSREALVVRQEKKYRRFKRGWEKQIAAPILQAEKFDAKLQKKLDRQAKRDVRKQRRRWKKLVSKLEQAVESQNAKALAKWEKSAAKAEKKGNPLPPKPELEAPDLPPEPQLQKILLADHKLNKKATKFRKKMVKRQGDLEVKFEKKDARMLHKLRKKVHKIARKLDDPEFVNEHPLLAGNGA